jgi:DNA-directed RNA polymerase sigma subunit (sigma70/sigma32)
MQRAARRPGEIWGLVAEGATRTLTYHEEEVLRALYTGMRESPETVAARYGCRRQRIDGMRRRALAKLVIQSGLAEQLVRACFETPMVTQTGRRRAIDWFDGT